MASIYRTGYARIDAESTTIDGAYVDTEAHTPNGPNWGERRRAQPINVLLPPTLRWMEALPEVVRPTTLGRLFPRIANRLAASWSSPHDCAACLHSLLVDDRGGRKGFPAEVLDDLSDLRDYLTQQNPLQDDIWSDVKR